MKRWLVHVILIVMIMFSESAQACTLWSAHGNLVMGGGSLIVKNRDWVPNQHQVLKLISPAVGYPYFGLYAEGKYPGMKAAINEKGLVVVSATAGSIPSEVRRGMAHTSRLLVKLVTECSSVDEVLTKSEFFVGPEILMIADRNKVATIEIGPEGRFSVSSQENGSIIHTNHYVNEELLEFNYKIGESSQNRYDRISELMDKGRKPFAFDDFISFSRDQNDGPDNSIFRVGSTSNKARTMATWAVRISLEGSPEVYVRILNPKEDEKVLRIVADDVFNGKIILD